MKTHFVSLSLSLFLSSITRIYKYKGLSSFTNAVPEAYAYTMWLTVWTSGNRAECLASDPFRLGEVHFAVESRSGAVNGVLLEGPGLEGEASGEGPKVGPSFFWVESSR